MAKKIIVFLVIYVVVFASISLIRGGGDKQNNDSHNSVEHDVQQTNAKAEQMPTVNKDECYEDYYSNAKEYYDKGQYESALVYLNKIDSDWSEYEKAKVLKDECSKLAKEEVLKTAAESAEAAEYDAAIKVLKDSRYAGDADVQVLIAQYENLLPVSLFEQNVFFGNIQDWAPYCSNVTDIEGNKYDSARMLHHTENYTHQSAYKIVFTLNNEFTTLCGKIVLPKGELDKNYAASNWLEFRDDNENVIAVSPSCNKSSPSVEFSIDVNGVKNLTIIGKRNSFLESGNTYVVGDLELYR